MHPAIARLQRIEDLDRLLAQTSDRPPLLFKHSLSCGTSAEALDELLDHVSDDKLDASYAIVTVQSHRELSNGVSTRARRPARNAAGTADPPRPRDLVGRLN